NQMGHTCCVWCHSNHLFTEKITVDVGQNVTLPCKVPNNQRPIGVVEWNRSDQETGNRKCFFLLSYQIPSFKHRVQLSDPRMKDGDVSVTVKNVTSSDSGEYECSFYISRKHRSRRATDFSYTVKLMVVDGESDMKLISTPLYLLIHRCNIRRTSGTFIFTRKQHNFSYVSI
uniref:Ig-like domain-containing protein n=1 Tax=Amphiprion percula TaxID=161767 RepID=A0A3P8TTB0_AMPPE